MQTYNKNILVGMCLVSN